MKHQTMKAIAVSFLLLSGNLTLAVSEKAKLAYEHLVRNTLSSLASPYAIPENGQVWYNYNGTTFVSQSLGNQQVIAETMRSELNPSLPQKQFVVLTERQYADGAPLAQGYYTAIGTRQFKTVGGSIRTLYAFVELPEDLSIEIDEYKAELDKTAAAEAAKHAEIENKKREAATTAKRKAVADVLADPAVQLEIRKDGQKANVFLEALAFMTARKYNLGSDWSSGDIYEAYNLAQESEDYQKFLNASKTVVRFIEKRFADDLTRMQAYIVIMFEIWKQDVQRGGQTSAAGVERPPEAGKSPEEIQRERREYAISALSSIDFDFQHHIVAQRSISGNVRIEMIDPAWDRLAELKTAGDWLGLLSAIDDDTFIDFPSQAEVNAIMVKLLNRPFKVKIKVKNPPSSVTVSYCNQAGIDGKWSEWGVAYIFGRSGSLDAEQSAVNAAITVASGLRSRLGGVQVESSGSLEPIKGETKMLKPLLGNVYVSKTAYIGNWARDNGIQMNGSYVGDDAIQSFESWLLSN